MKYTKTLGAVISLSIAPWSVFGGEHIRLIPTASQGGTTWKYMETSKRFANWGSTALSHKDWRNGIPGFGNGGVNTKTPWSGGKNDLYLRKAFRFDFAIKQIERVNLTYAIDDEIEIQLNGSQILQTAHRGHAEYLTIDVTAEFKRYARGSNRENIIAVKAHDNGAACYVDVGLEVVLLDAPEKEKPTDDKLTPVKTEVRGRRPQRPNGIVDIDRRNLPKLWSAPGVKEHVLKRNDGGDDLVFIECPPGDFTMGYREDIGNAFSKHRVTLTYPFWILKTQLTKGQAYMSGVCEHMPKGSRHGANSLGPGRMAAYLHELNRIFASQIPKDYVIRFPTFVEYQYAYRANSTDPSDPYTHSRFEGNDSKRICLDSGTRKRWNGNHRTWPRVWAAEVGLLEPNAWGLYDMAGNGYTYLCDRINPDLSQGTHFSYREHEIDPIIYEEDAGRMLMRGGDSPDWIYQDFFCTWRWAFSYRLVVGPDLERKGRQQMRAKNLARHDACFEEMINCLPKRKSGPREALSRKSITLFSGCSVEFVECPPGTFTMGHETADGPFRQHEVTISRPFYMATERMTFDVWFKYLKVTGQVIPEELRRTAMQRGGVRSALCGIKDEDWDSFLLWLNSRNSATLRKSVFRLPTEAEWEYAYRAGARSTDDPFAWTVPFLGRQESSASPFSYTEDDRRDDFERLGGGDVVKTAWEAYTFDWRRKALVPPGVVGTKKPNYWGLKDMIGNGREWVLDRFSCAAGKFPAASYGQMANEIDPLLGYELDKWDCQMSRGGDDGYAGRKCWDANGSDWGEDVYYPGHLFCRRLVIGPDLLREKREKAGVHLAEVKNTNTEKHLREDASAPAGPSPRVPSKRKESDFGELLD